jgi:hypothetical protein
MMFNDRRKTRIQSAKERQRVHNLVRDTGAFISSSDRRVSSITQRAVRTVCSSGRHRN